MAKRFERHARSRLDGWGPDPSRSAELAAAVAEPAVKPRARKDTRRWCKGKPGREHVPVVVFEPMYPGHDCHEATGWRRQFTRGGWVCQHRERCENCGRVLRDRDTLGSECPDYAMEG